MERRHASQSDAGLPGPGCWPLRDPLMMFQSFKSHAIVYHWHVSLSFCPYRLTLSHIHTCSRTHAHARTHASAQKIKRVELIHKQTRWSGVDAVRGAIGMIASADGKKSNAVRKNKQKENMSVAVRRVGCSARCRAGRQKTIPSLSDDVSIEYSAELHSGTVGAWREIWSSCSKEAGSAPGDLSPRAPLAFHILHEDNGGAVSITGPRFKGEKEKAKDVAFD